MRWASIAAKAKEYVDKRGGTEALKQDAEELRRIAKEPGSMSEKAKKAAEALKEPRPGGKTEAPEGAAGPTDEGSASREKRPSRAD